MKPALKQLSLIAVALSISSLSFAVGEVDRSWGETVAHWVNEIGNFKILFFAIFALMGICLTGFGILQMVNSQDDRKKQEAKFGVGLAQALGGVALISLTVTIMLFSNSLLQEDSESNSAIYGDDFREY